MGKIVDLDAPSAGIRARTAQVNLGLAINPMVWNLHKRQDELIMAKRRGNPNWGKPEPIGPVIPIVTSFEQAVKEFKLQPDQYLRSTRLREWARRNKNSKFIPESLLQAWGFEIESTL